MNKEEALKNEPCYQGRFWDNTKKDFVSWSELIKKDDG